MADAENIGRINIWRNSTIAASAATAERGTNAFGRMSVYRSEAIARSRRHHEVPAGGGYKAPSVHFDGTAYLSTANLTAPGDDTGFFTSVKWIKIPADGWASGAGLWQVDPEDTYPSSEGPQSLDHKGWAVALDDAGASHSLDTGSNVDAGTLSEGVWLPIMASAKTNFDAGDKVLQVYIGDTPYTFAGQDITSAFLMTFNGLPFFLISDSFATVKCDLSDTWIAPGQFIDFSVEANRRKFIDADGKPVYLGANGELPTGTSPAVFFSGDSSTFATNKGTGGTFTLTGSLTNASSSPSD